MTTKAINKRESIALPKFLSALKDTLVFLSSFLLFTMVFVPLSIAERGHMAFGGEWVLIVGLSMLITLIFAKK